MCCYACFHLIRHCIQYWIYVFHWQPRPSSGHFNQPPIVGGPPSSTITPGIMINTVSSWRNLIELADVSCWLCTYNMHVFLMCIIDAIYNLYIVDSDPIVLCRCPSTCPLSMCSLKSFTIFSFSQSQFGAVKSSLSDQNCCSPHLVIRRALSLLKVGSQPAHDGGYHYFAACFVLHQN